MESRSLEFRCDVFKTLSHTLFDNSDSSVNPPHFMRTARTGGPEIQFITKVFIGPIVLALAAVRLSAAVNREA